MMNNLFEGRLEVDKNLELYYQIFKNSSKLPWLIVTHGVGEYCDRYHFFQDVLKKNFNILLFDNRGHGRSDGKKGYVESFDFFSSDLKKMINFLQEYHQMKSYSLFAHSMGALVNLHCLQNFPLDLLKPERVFLSAPPFFPGGFQGSLSKIFPSFLLKGLSQVKFGFWLKDLIAEQDLTSHKAGDLNYSDDPLVLGGMNSRLLFNILKTGRVAREKNISIKTKVFIIVGEKDIVVHRKEIEEYCKKIDPSITLKVFPRGKHELHNEIPEIRTPYLEYLKNCLVS